MAGRCLGRCLLPAAAGEIATRQAVLRTVLQYEYSCLYSVRLYSVQPYGPYSCTYFSTGATILDRAVVR
jgi:hypothetical protein